MKIQSPKGTRDFYPELQSQIRYIFEHWQRSCQLFGYEEYEGPMFEHLELFTDKSGDEIVTQLYDFNDKGGRHLALRPEMTPTLARLVNQKGRELKKPFKWFSIPRLFRYERAQKGRLREFFQLNMDIMGSKSILAEADLLQAIVFMLEAFGLGSNDFVIGISSRRLLAAILSESGVQNPMPVYAALDKKAKISPEAFSDLLAQAGLEEQQQSFLESFMNSKSLADLSEFCRGEASTEALKELQELFNLLQSTGLSPYIALDLGIVRGLAYYTGIIFEVFDRARSLRAVAGGGRYEDLCAKLGGEAIPGVGFGMGDVVLRELLLEKKLLPEKGSCPDYYIAHFQENSVKLLDLARKLRSAGLSCIHPLGKMKFGKQMEAAHYNRATRVLFLDSEKGDETHFEVKEMQTGEQKVLSLEEILKND